VVTVIDHVISTDASFPKRWLLHSLSQPNPTTGGFIIEPRTAHSPKHSADRLQSQVLLPRHASVVAIGGSGAEFLVEDVNYDEHGTLGKKIASSRLAEPGVWRIEVTPRIDSLETSFLVVMALGGRHARTLTKARLQSDPTD